MKRLIFFLLVLSPLLVSAQTSDTEVLSPNVIPNLKGTESSKTDSIPLATSYLSLLFDPGLSIRSGSESILLAHYGISRAEDKVLGTRWFSEDGFLKKSGGVLGRFTKYLLLVSPVDLFFILLSHEYFGHGSRYRELDLGKVNYHFEVPLYGGGDSYAHISGWPRPMSDHELLTIWQGGFEAHNIINRRLNLRWVANRESHYREASLYFWTWQDRFQYIQGTTEELSANLTGSLYDPEGYTWFLNRHAGYDNPQNLLMTLSDLKKRNLVNLINPFLWYSLFVQFKTYIYDGNTNAGLPMLRLGSIYYMPSMRMNLTPFGPEYHLENYLQIRSLVSCLDVRIGDQTFYQDWWGLGMLFQNIYAKNRFSLDGNLDIWQQPKLEIEGNSFSSTDKGLGAAFSLRGHYDFTNSRYPISFIAELGYKSSGFLQGYVLDASPIILVGLGIRN
jgi:hypothetical protein